MTDPGWATVPPVVLPQTYPLWLAENEAGDIRTGRVVGWRVEPGGRSMLTPLVAFVHRGAELTQTGVPKTGQVWLADSEQAAREAIEAHLAARQTPTS